MTTRRRGRIHVLPDWVHELDVVDDAGPLGAAPDLARHIHELPHSLHLNPDIPFERGDFLLAGRGFLAGLRTDWPALVLTLSGVGGVLCESIATAFRESALHAGLPLLVLPGLRAALHNGDDVIVDVATGTIENVSTHHVLIAPPLAPGELQTLRQAPARALYGLLEDPTDPDVIEERRPRPPPEPTAPTPKPKPLF